MLKHLGTFTILAVCLFAVVIVMGGCEKPMDQMLPPPVTPETDAPETGETDTGETDTDAPETGVAGASPYNSPDNPDSPYYGLDWETIAAIEEEPEPEEEN